MDKVYEYFSLWHDTPKLKSWVLYPLTVLTTAMRRRNAQQYGLEATFKILSFPRRTATVLQFLHHKPVGRTLLVGDQSAARPLPTHRSIQTSMPRMGFEHTTPVFKQTKVVHASDLAATVIGSYFLSAPVNPSWMRVDPYQFVGWSSLSFRHENTATHSSTGKTRWVGIFSIPAIILMGLWNVLSHFLPAGVWVSIFIRYSIYKQATQHVRLYITLQTRVREVVGSNLGQGTE
jgi:hypothetical protein